MKNLCRIDLRKKDHVKRFSSKGEQELRDILIEKFPEYKWQRGGKWKIADKTYKSLDIFNKNIKLIIEYDGIYHFKDIYGNLEEVQLKDRLLEEWCVKNKWKIIRVNEKTFKQKRFEVLSIIFDMINNIDIIDNVNKLYLIEEYKPAS